MRGSRGYPEDSLEPIVEHIPGIGGPISLQEVGAPGPETLLEGHQKTDRAAITESVLRARQGTTQRGHRVDPTRPEACPPVARPESS